MRGKVFNQPRRFWSEEEDQQVWQMYVDGADYADIAARFNSTIAAAQSRIYKIKRRPND